MKFFKLFLFSILMLFSNCLTREIIDNYAYHPLVTKNLCRMKIVGKKENLHSVSILLDHGNVTDLSYEELVKEGFHVIPESEYFLSQGNFAKTTSVYSIPCKNQFIRIQYFQENQKLSFNLPLQVKKIQTISLIQPKSGGLSYEVK